MHSEFNPSASEPLHLLQIWLLPGRRGLAPGYEQRPFDREQARGRFALIAGPHGGSQAVTIHQDATLSVAILAGGESATHEIAPGRHGWVQIARGEVTLKGESLSAGDGAAIDEPGALTISAVGAGRGTAVRPGVVESRPMPSRIRYVQRAPANGRRGRRRNVTTSNVGPLTRLTLVREGLPSEILVDTYHYLIRASWPALFGLILAVFIVANCLFAIGYLIDGGIENARHGSFGDAFFFSVQTMATIGYGKMAPVTTAANILVSFEALFGLMALALVTGLVFAKFSRPSSGVRFSRYAVLSVTVSREAHDVIFTWAGPEIAVASTKAYTTQLEGMVLFGLYLAQVKGTLSRKRSGRSSPL